MIATQVKARAGLDVLLEQRLDMLQGVRVGLVSNPTGVTADVTSNLDALRAAGVEVVALFGPEHGFASHVQDGLTVASGTHARTGLPVYSLYGDTRQPTADMLRGLDALVFDIQDAGVRFYTYLWTMTMCMAAGAEHDVPVIVLDRPNPIGGEILEGPVLQAGLESFVGLYPVPLRYGLTIGELARLVNEEFGIGADLTVIPLEGWRRELWYDQTGLPWVAPSPNLPALATATVYPGTCLIEGTNLSEGRGTTQPFELVGAPWLDGDRLAETLNALDLPGVRFRPATFTPTFSKHAGLVCAGVQLHVLDRAVFRPVTAALHLIAAAREQAPSEFGWQPAFAEGPAPFERLVGDAQVRPRLEAGEPVEDIVAGWEDGRRQWEAQRAPYLMY